MGISAFLAVPMANEKEKQKIELRPVDEEVSSNIRFVRLEKDAAVEMEEQTPVRLGERISPDLSPDPSGKEDVRTRSVEPDMSSLIEIDNQMEANAWELEAAPNRNLAWGWIALVTCVFAAAILWSLANLNKVDGEGAKLAKENRFNINQENQEEIDAETQVSTIEKAVRNFLGSKSVEERLRYVRHPERVSPLMKSFYAESPLKPMRIKDLLSLEPLTMDNRASYWVVSCELEGKVRAQLLLESITIDEARVDWETFVCHQPMAWDELAKNKPNGYTGDFRVYVQKDHNHSHEFSDSTAFDCYRLTALNGDEVLFGYVPRGRGIGLRMDEVTAGKEGQTVSMLLRLHIPQDLKSPQGVVIQEIVSSRWFFMDDPKEGEP